MKKEDNKGKVTLRDLNTGEEAELSPKEAILRIKNEIEKGRLVTIGPEIYRGKNPDISPECLVGETIVLFSPADIIVYDLRLIKKEQGEWLDRSGNVVHGEESAYIVESEHFGKLVINLRLPDDLSSAHVFAVGSEDANNRIISQLKKRKSSWYVKVPGKKAFYQRIGLAKIDESGKVKVEKVTRQDDVPSQIGDLEGITLTTYGKVRDNESIAHHLTAIIPADKPDLLVHLFIRSRIIPLAGEINKQRHKSR